MSGDHAPFERKGREEALLPVSVSGQREGGGALQPSGSEVAWELALFTAVEGGMVEEGAGGAAPLRPLVLLLVCSRLHYLTPHVHR